MGGACCDSVPESFRVKKNHSVVLSGTQWYSVVISMSPHFLFYRDVKEDTFNVSRVLDEAAQVLPFTGK
jgi:hypothetical protein